MEPIAHADPKRKRLLLAELIAVLAALYLPVLVAQVLIRTQEDFGWEALAYRTASEIGQIALIFFVVFVADGSVKSLGFVRPKWVDLPLVGVLLSLFWLVWLALSQLPPSWDPDHGMEDYWKFVGAFGRAPLVPMVLSLAVAVVYEEVLVRGYVIPRVTELSGAKWFAVLASASLFAMNHIYQGSTGVVNTFLLGLGFGLAFAMTGRIWPMLVAHFAYNLYFYLWARSTPWAWTLG